MADNSSNDFEEENNKVKYNPQLLVEFLPSVFTIVLQQFTCYKYFLNTHLQWLGTFAHGGKSGAMNRKILTLLQE